MKTDYLWPNYRSLKRLAAVSSGTVFAIGGANFSLVCELDSLQRIELGQAKLSNSRRSSLLMSTVFLLMKRIDRRLDIVPPKDRCIVYHHTPTLHPAIVNRTDQAKQTFKNKTHKLTS